MMSSINSFAEYTPNPGGHLWLKDENGFGKKLLKKMGWSNGKGLGRNEDGITECIKWRVSKNKIGENSTDMNGVRCGNTPCEEYDLLLSNLYKSYLPKENSENNIENHKDTGLEQRSQQFKKRLHYRKFVIGKDISRYSEKDMQSIFLSKQIDSKKAEVDEKKSLFNGLQDEFSITTDEYFAKKLKKSCEQKGKKDRAAEAENNYDNEDDLKQSLNNHFNDELLMEPEPDSVKKVSRKKRKKSEELQRKSKKLKTSKLAKLKSCLKGKHNSKKLTLPRQVSFNENFSFRTFNNELEATSMSDEKVSSILSEEKMELLCSESNENIDLNDQISESGKLFEKNEDADPKLAVEMIESKDDKNEILDESAVKRENKNCENRTLIPEPDDFDDTLKPIKCPSVYNSWIKSQRQALKRKNNKKRKKHKKIKEHAILQTSNLAPIKGKGNSKKKTLAEQVSFNEHFSFRTFNDELEATSMSDEKISSVLSQEKMELLCGESNENIDLNGQISESDILFEKNEDADPKLAVEMIESKDEKNETLDESGVERQHKNCENRTLIPEPDYLDDTLTPIKHPSLYNSWIESQRLALKMEIYKKMYKKIKEHAILQTSNFAQIKGYGNWGF